MFGQTFSPQDLLLIALLVVLEGALSIDNALVLGLLARRLPKQLQRRALTYGLIGAFVFRIIAIAAAAWLLEWRIVKLLGGLYLLYVAIHHVLLEVKKKDKIALDAQGNPILIDPNSGRPLPANHQAHGRSGHGLFWSTVGVIELTDIAFAVDSILAAIALVGPAPLGTPQQTLHPKLWVVVIGGMLGVILMRVAAVVFIKLLERFPRFELSAYLLVFVIGFKLLLDWWFNTPAHPHTLNFHDFHNPVFWVFWIIMLLCLAAGFIPPRGGAEIR